MPETIRHFVLVEPFGPNDVSIYNDRDYPKALRLQADYTAEGKATKFVSGTGTIADIRIELRKLRAASTLAETAR